MQQPPQQQPGLFLLNEGIFLYSQYYPADVVTTLCRRYHMPASAAEPTELTLREVARLAGYHYSYVRYVVSKNLLPSVKRGQHRYVQVSSLLAYVKQKNPPRVPYVEAQLAVVDDPAA